MIYIKEPARPQTYFMVLCKLFNDSRVNCFPDQRQENKKTYPSHGSAVFLKYNLQVSFSLFLLKILCKCKMAL